jgi:hypothetical protein
MTPEAGLIAGEGGSIRVVKAGTGTTRCAESFDLAQNKPGVAPASPRFHHPPFAGASAPNEANRRRFSVEIGFLQAKRSQISQFPARRVPYPISTRKYSITEPGGLGALSSFMQSKPNFQRAERVVNPIAQNGYKKVSEYGREKQSQFKANWVRRET